MSRGGFGCSYCFEVVVVGRFHGLVLSSFCQIVGRLATRWSFRVGRWFVVAGTHVSGR